jgi:segregation and condensation protein B
MPTPSQNPGEGPEDRGISLEELTNAFAEAMRGPQRPRPPEEAADSPAGQSDAAGAQAEGGTSETEAESEAPEDREAGDAAEARAAESREPGDVAAEQQEVDEDAQDDACPVGPESILEAMLFVGNQYSAPLRPESLAEPMRGVEPAEVPALVAQLNRKYEQNGCPYRIASEGDGYRMVLDERFEAIRARFYGRVRQARLSQAAIDVLAIVAYQQPLTRDDVSRLRGRPSGHILSQLVHRRLLEIRRSREKPRTGEYHTTERFLELFGLDSLDDLPQAEEISG